MDVHLLADSASPKDNVPKSLSEPFKVVLHEDSFHTYKLDPIPVSYTHLTLPTICSV